MFYFYSLTLLALADIAATHYQIWLAKTTAIEANPLMRWVIEDFGMPIAYVIRVAVPFILVPVILYTQELLKDQGELSSWVDRLFASNRLLQLMFIVHVGVILWHIYQTNCFTIHV